MHLIKNLTGTACVQVVTLRGKYEFVCKCRIPKETPDARYDLPIIQFDTFIANNDGLLLECWVSRELVNNSVKLFRIAI